MSVSPFSLPLTYWSLLLCLLAALPCGAQDAAEARKGRHEVSTTVGITRIPAREVVIGWWTEQLTGQDLVGTGFAYHYLHPVRKVWIGGGGGYETMGTGRAERLATLSGLVEYRHGDHRWQPTARLLAGLNLPVGHRDEALLRRRAGLTLHPSVGGTVRLGERRRRSLLISAGYRLAWSGYDWQQWAGNEVSRQIVYRRLSLTLALRI